MMKGSIRGGSEKRRKILAIMKKLLPLVFIDNILP
jgi:hypothetical protein